jgi:hypothetical protein
MRCRLPHLECQADWRVGFEHNQDYFSCVAVTEGPGICCHKVGIKRSVLVFENRLLEILVYLVVGILLFVLGLLAANVNYQVLFFILTAFFIFAIFRPSSLS